MANIAPLRKPVKCPSCDTDSRREFYPFCSERCSKTDLHRWFAGSYAIQGKEADFIED